MARSPGSRRPQTARRCSRRRQPRPCRRSKRGLRRGHPPTRRRWRRHPHRGHLRTSRRQSPRPGYRHRRLAGGSATPPRHRPRTIGRLKTHRARGYSRVPTRRQVPARASPTPHLRAGLPPPSQSCLRLGADHYTQRGTPFSVPHRLRPHHCAGCQILALCLAVVGSRLPGPRPLVKRRRQCRLPKVPRATHQALQLVRPHARRPELQPEQLIRQHRWHHLHQYRRHRQRHSHLRPHRQHHPTRPAQPPEPPPQHHRHRRAHHPPPGPQQPRQHGRRHSPPR